MMHRNALNAVDAPQPTGNYAQAVEISGFQRLVFVSGQIPVNAEGRVPEGFEAQARQVWQNIDAQLRATAMTRENLVKVTIFLSDRSHAVANRKVRQDYLGTLTPALTVIIAGIFDESWLLEIEAVAAE